MSDPETLWPEPLVAGQIGRFRDAQVALARAVGESSTSPADIDLLTREVLSLAPAARESEGCKCVWRETARVREHYGLSPLAPPAGEAR